MYVKESQVHLLLVLFIIVLTVFLLLLIFNRFKIKNINYDQIIAGAILSVSLFFYYQTLLFQIPETVNITSPALLPGIWIITLIILSVILIFRSKGHTAEKTAYSPKTVIIIIAMLLAYLVAMQWIGYFITTPVFILSTMYLLKYRKPAFMTINAFGFVLFSYFIFQELLHIDLPLGWLFI